MAFRWKLVLESSSVWPVANEFSYNGNVVVDPEALADVVRDAARGEEGNLWLFLRVLPHESSR